MSFALMPAPPLGLAYIAGTLKNDGHDIQVIDTTAEGVYDTEYFKNDIYVYGLNKEKTVQMVRKDVEVICISFMFTNNWLYDRELVKDLKIKFPETVIIAGGEHANAVPEYCMKQAPVDYIVFGEGEETVSQLVTCIQNGTDTALVDG